jgi:hypothetical protein
VKEISVLTYWLCSGLGIGTWVVRSFSPHLGKGDRMAVINPMVASFGNVDDALDVDHHCLAVLVLRVQ